MHNLKRAVHFDFHNMPGIDNFAEDFDAKEFAATLKDANVDYINMFARCNVGFSYYDTKIGIKYPTLKSNMLKDCIDECHKNQIGVSAYINGGVNHQVCINHPEFMKINKIGQVMSDNRESNNFFRTPCFNSGYREYLLSEIEEILELEPDGIFCDCMIPFSCYCPECVSKMKEKNIDISDDNSVYKYSQELIIDVIKDIRNIVPKNKRLFVNSVPYESVHSMLSHLELECLPTDPLWGYDFFGLRAPYYRNFTDDRIYMTGKFLGGWGEFGTLKAKAALENDMYDAVMNGYGISVGDHLDPSGELSRDLFNIIKESFSFVKQMEKWTDDANPCSDVCIVRNKYSSNAVSDKGAVSLLSELKICYDIKDEDMDLSGYRLIVLPDSIDVTDKLEDKLTRSSAAILSSGTSLKNGGLWNFISEFHTDTHTTAYYQVKNQEINNMFCPAVKMKSDCSISAYYEPWFDKIWDGIHGYFYTPPKRIKTPYSAIARRNNVVHICFNIFEAYHKFGAVYLKNQIKDIINLFIGDKLICADELPQSTRVTLWSKADYKLLFIKSTFPELRGKIGIIEEHSVIPSGRKIKVKGTYSDIQRLPDCNPLKFTNKDGYTEIILPEINGFLPIVLK